METRSEGNTESFLIGHEPHVYDYIVCGGGPSGCALACRLAENGSTSVLLIEAGDGEHEDSKVPAGGAALFQPPSEWGVSTTPQAGLCGRSIPVAHARLLGGSTMLNGTLVVRGLKSDFDAWRVPGWNGEIVFQHMKRAECFRGKDWYKQSEDVHGERGIVETEPQELAPISELCLESFRSVGLQFKADMSSSGEIEQGCGHAVRTTCRGERSTAHSYIHHQKHTRSDQAGGDAVGATAKLHIATSTIVDQVILEPLDTPSLANGGTPHATYKVIGVLLHTSDGTQLTVHARRETILSAGTYHTPGILQRSGIGSPDLLRPLGIGPLVNSLGVGRNLRDHLICSLWYKIRPSAAHTFDGTPLTKDAVWHSPSGFHVAMGQWQKDRSGYMASFPFGAFAFAKLSSQLGDLPDDVRNQKAPHVELFNTECYIGPPEYGEHPTDGSHVFAMTVMLLHPRSMGTVSLPAENARNSDAKPIVDHGYLSDEHGIDVKVLAEGCRFADQLVRSGKGTKDIIEGTWPMHDERDNFTIREQWMQWVRENATTCYHPVGSCKMGRADHDDKDVVVDERLRVRGVQGLRVADCSVMPTLNSGHTQMVAYAIGEKAAEMVREDATAAKVS